MAQNHAEPSRISEALKNFDSLPDSALIDIACLKGITGKSRTTVYRWMDKGTLPKPRVFGQGSSNNYWIAGEIRRAIGI